MSIPSASSSNRRRFLQTAAAGVAAPFFIPGRTWAQDAAPNERIVMGFIGMGKQMGGLLNRFLQYPNVQVVAVCDVDTTRREDAKAKVDKAYGNTNCKAVNDFRDITTNKDINAVCIATPDHWHAIISLSAVTNGKDVYCEKPLTHNIHEAVALVETVRKHGRILQTGSMQRSSAEFRIACELVRNGVIGEVKTVDTSFGGPAKPCDLPEEAMEPGLDWNMWLGPAPLRPYNSELSPRGICKNFPMGWRYSREYGGGMVTDWGAHHVDIAHWGLGMDENGPVEVRPPADWKTASKGAQLVYASGVILNHVTGRGCSFFGTEGEMHVNRGKFELVLGGKTKAKFWDKEVDKGTSLQREYTLMEREFLANPQVKPYNSKDQIQDFLACIKSRQKPVCDVGIGASSSVACHLLSLAYYHGATMKWDPIKNQFISGGDPSWLTREYRGEFKVA